jgi:hypothetical protein
MPSAKLLAAAAAGAILFAGQAHAAVFRTEAKLASPAAQPLPAAVGDEGWRCDADSCVAERRQQSLDNPMRQCRKVAAALGTVTAFASEGLKFDAGDLKSCNRAAKDGGAATAGK